MWLPVGVGTVVELTVDVVAFVLSPATHGGAQRQVALASGRGVVQVDGQTRVVTRLTRVTGAAQLRDLNTGSRTLQERSLDRKSRDRGGQRRTATT